MNPQPPVRRLVLIVDDDALLREYLAEVLQHAGHDTLGAGTAAEALRMIEERGDGIALVLLDIEMPGMSGLALARLLREETTIPFMFLSASDDAETARAAADAGAVGGQKSDSDNTSDTGDNKRTRARRNRG